MLDSNDTKGFSKAIATYLKSDETTNKAVTQGPERARLFSWRTSAQKCLDVLEEIA